VARFGLVSAYLRFTKPWRKLEQYTADAWLRRFYGDKIYEMVWRPLLIGKFGPYYQEANMAWMWARLHVRSPRLGYFEGGFQAMVDALTAAVKQRGGQVLLQTPFTASHQTKGRFTLQVEAPASKTSYDLSWSQPHRGCSADWLPGLPPDYLGQLLS
jgi:protoporphyrinogen oxidase